MSNHPVIPMRCLLARAAIKSFVSSGRHRLDSSGSVPHNLGWKHDTSIQTLCQDNCEEHMHVQTRNVVYFSVSEPYAPIGNITFLQGGPECLLLMSIANVTLVDAPYVLARMCIRNRRIGAHAKST
jgi:hypothetical protein